MIEDCPRTDIEFDVPGSSSPINIGPPTLDDLLLDEVMAPQYCAARVTSRMNFAS
jgi:hypothetical protein